RLASFPGDARLARQAERALGDDVPLDLVRARIDRVRAGEEKELLQAPELVGRAGDDLALRTEDVHRELPELAVPGRPIDLRDHRGAAESRPLRVAESAERIEAHHAKTHPGGDEPLADHRVRDAAVPLRRRDDLRELVREERL